MCVDGGPRLQVIRREDKARLFIQRASSDIEESSWKSAIRSIISALPMGTMTLVKP